MKLVENNNKNVKSETLVSAFDPEIAKIINEIPFNDLPLYLDAYFKENYFDENLRPSYIVSIAEPVKAINGKPSAIVAKSGMGGAPSVITYLLSTVIYELKQQAHCDPKETLCLIQECLSRISRFAEENNAPKEDASKGDFKELIKGLVQNAAKDNPLSKN